MAFANTLRVLMISVVLPPLFCSQATCSFLEYLHRSFLGPNGSRSDLVTDHDVQTSDRGNRLAKTSGFHQNNDGHPIAELDEITRSETIPPTWPTAVQA